MDTKDNAGSDVEGLMEVFCICLNALTEAVLTEFAKIKEIPHKPDTEAFARRVNEIVEEYEEKLPKGPPYEGHRKALSKFLSALKKI